jgi:hypothetical protein
MTANFTDIHKICKTYAGYVDLNPFIMKGFSSLRHIFTVKHPVVLDWFVSGTVTLNETWIQCPVLGL